MIVDGERLSFFLPKYPSSKDPDVSYKLYQNEEFLELTLSPAEDVKGAGSPLNHQKIFQRLISPHTPYRKILAAYRMGTGKTCLVSLVEEIFKDTIVNGKPRKPALILVPNQELANQYIYQISKVCTVGVYDTASYTARELAAIERGEKVRLTERAKAGRIKSKVSEFYEIQTHQAFLTSIRGLSDEQLREYYDDRIIILDEAHQFRIQPKPRVPEGKKARQVQRDIITEEMYQQMKHFLRILLRSRIILLTGTPIWDKTDEIASLLNLIADSDEEELATKSEFYKKYYNKDRTELTGEKEIRKAMHGKVAYLREMEADVTRREIGAKNPWTEYVTVYPSAMSPFQRKYAYQAKKEVTVTKMLKGGEIRERKIEGGAVQRTAKSAATLVLPVIDSKGNVIGGSYDNSYLLSLITLDQRNDRWIWKKGDQAHNQKVEWVKYELRNNLEKYSSKIAAVVYQLKNNPTEKAYISSEAVTGPGGAICLALILELHGFVWATEARHITPKVDTSGKLVIPSKKHFMIITASPGTTRSPPIIQKMIAGYNLQENNYADFCQILIGSEKTNLGFNLVATRQFHELFPRWNIPSDEQTLYRTLRLGSFTNLRPDERYVKIFRHIAAVEYQEGDNPLEEDLNGQPLEVVTLDQSFPPNTTFTNEETIDIHIYRIAEQKERSNIPIYRLLKEEDVLCPLVYQRNVLYNDKDGTRPCDYQKCNYVCSGYPEDLIDKSQKVWYYTIPENEIKMQNKTNLYSKDEMENIKSEIIKLFGVHFNLKIEETASLLGFTLENESDRWMFLTVIDNMIAERVPIKNRYGFNSYLKEDGDILFLDYDISPFSKYADGIYIQNPYITNITTLEDISEIEILKMDSPAIDIFCHDPTSELGKKKFNELNHRTQILLLESIYEIEKRKGFKNMSAREKAVRSILNKRFKEEIRTMPDGNIIHLLYTTEYTGTSYNVTVKEIKVTGKMRIFDQRTGKWKFLTDGDKEEEYVNTLVSEKKKNKPGKKEKEADDPYDDNPYGVHGFIDKTDHRFKLKFSFNPEKGHKKEKRGRQCTSYDIIELQQIYMENLKTFPPPFDVTFSKTKSELIQGIRAKPIFNEYKDDLEERDIDYLRGFWSLLYSSKECLCDCLAGWFDENELMDKRGNYIPDPKDKKKRKKNEEALECPCKVPPDLLI